MLRNKRRLFAMVDGLRDRDERSGSTDHLRVYSVPGVADLTVRGLAECTCGVRYPVGRDCPDAAETWRGPKAEGTP